LCAISGYARSRSNSSTDHDGPIEGSSLESAQKRGSGDAASSNSSDFQLIGKERRASLGERMWGVFARQKSTEVSVKEERPTE